MGKYTPYSELKIFRHTEHINKFLRGERVAPIYVRIKPTNICNQRCFYCAYANDSLFDAREVNQRESISWNILESTLYQMKDMGVKAVTFSGGGEPLCYSHIIEALQTIEILGIDCSMITNAQALENECAKYLKKAKWVRVSFDTAKAVTYEKTRGVNTYNRVCGNIETFAHIKDINCTLGINCVITHNNANEIFDICSLVKKLGVNNIKLSPILVKSEMKKYHTQIKDKVTEQIREAKSRLENEKFRIIDKYTDDIALEGACEKEYSRCHIQNFFTVIAADSKVYRCHQRAYMTSGEIGDLTKASFKDIWYSQETVDKLDKFNPKKECMFRCAFDERNKLLNDFFDLDENHINFI